METEDVIISWVGLILGLALVFGLPYGCYRYGRFVERRLLTEAFMKTMEQDYNVGYESGHKDGYKLGRKDGEAVGRLQILQEEDENGRY